ncbi:putative Nuclear pore complex component [Seiridium cardinale]
MSSSTLQKTLSTPTKAAPSPAPESPGNWRHPRLQEITRRQNASTFSDKNVRKIAWNVAAITLVTALISIVYKYTPIAPYGGLANTISWAYRLFLCAPIFNIGLALLPLVRPKDDLSDIPLTPGQRKLLGLQPSSAPPTPGSVYSTPPRYSRTPSISGSTGSKRSFSGFDSPSAYRSPTEGNSGGLGAYGPAFSPAGSPLIHKALNGARRSSLGSIGSPGSLGKSFGASTSIFGGGPDSPSPSPLNGKRSTVALNNKWLYERGRRGSGNAWAS